MTIGKEKIKNAIAFFAVEHERLAHESLGLDSLRRYLASVGYRSFEGRRHPILMWMERSHILVDIDGKPVRVEGDCFSLVPHDGGYVVKATCLPDLDCFSPFELLGMRRTVEVGVAALARRVDSVLDIQEAKRRMIWVGKQADVDREPPNKRKEVRKMSGLQLLTERYVTQLKDLETRMAEVKQKLETVMEASRLLQEEGLSEDGPSETFQRT
jgi:hypothetical protein